MTRALGSVAIACWLSTLLVVSMPCRAQTPADADALEPNLDTAIGGDELQKLADTLKSPDARRRERALDALSSLGEDALPAIEGQLARIARQTVESAAVLNALTELRTSQGVHAPDGEVDLLRGAAPLLARDRGRAAVLAAELVALLRALEAQKSPHAAEIIVGKLFALNSKWFRYEAQRTRARLGVLLVPALIRYRAHPRPWLRKFCQDTLAAMHVEEPGRAVQQNDVALLAAILDAYGDTLTFDAMPVVVSYVTDERSEVRRAARQAVARFGKNAIWQLRERYLNATGKEANPTWSHQRVLAEITRWYEAPKRALIDGHLKAAEEALADDDYRTAEARLEDALRVTPFGAAVQRIAPLYVRVAGHYEAAGELEHALACLQRALRLDPEGSERGAVLARVKYFQAELRLARGQVDLSAYRKALELDPSLSEARAVLEELTGEARQRERTRRKVLALVAALVLASAGFLALRARPKTDEPEPTEEVDEASEPSA